MSDLHLLRIPIDAPRLLRFATEHGIKQEDETLGYTLHAWFAALFRDQAPKPFRYIERRSEVLAYASTDAATLLAQAQAFASPQAWAALDPEGVASKPRTRNMVICASQVSPSWNRRNAMPPRNGRLPSTSPAT